MIISNWSILRLSGVVHISGHTIDNPRTEDGQDIMTSPIAFTDGQGLKTQSGSVYYLGAPSPNQNPQELEDLRAQLPATQTPTPKPFAGVIENWAPFKRPDGAQTFIGRVFSKDGTADGEDIMTSGIAGIDGQFIVTKSGTRYALGTPHPDVPEGAKSRILSALRQDQHGHGASPEKS